MLNDDDSKMFEFQRSVTLAHCVTINPSHGNSKINKNSIIKVKKR